MKALVTGARGFIGSFLVEKLLQEGWEVSCLLRHKPGARDWLPEDKIQRIAGDLTQPQTLLPAVAGVDVIFHLAGATKAPDAEGYLQANAKGTKHLLEAVKQANPDLRRFIFVSSLAAAGPSPDGHRLVESEPSRPISFYGKSKLRAEEHVLEYRDDFPVTIVRPPAVFGPREKDMFTYFQMANRGWQPLIGGGPRYLSLIYVKDLVSGLLLMAKREEAEGKTFYLCDDRDYSWEELGAHIAEALGKKTHRIVVPLSLAFVVAAISDIYSRVSRTNSILNLDKYKELKATHWICDAGLAKKEVGFRIQYPLDEALAETARWYREQGWLS